MTPEGHAVKAEGLLEEVEDFLEDLRDEDKEPTDSEILASTLTAARAQVHATLSLRRPQQSEQGFVPRHDNLGPAELAEPIQDDYCPGS